jgi:hypothetical protein
MHYLVTHPVQSLRRGLIEIARQAREALTSIALARVPTDLQLDIAAHPLFRTASKSKCSGSRMRVPVGEEKAENLSQA